jgi:hypothetical protein
MVRTLNSFLRSLQRSCQEILLNFMKPKIYHDVLQRPATDPCLDPGKSSPNHHTVSLKCVTYCVEPRRHEVIEVLELVGIDTQCNKPAPSKTPEKRRPIRTDFSLTIYSNAICLKQYYR